jgi:hypothetical protein
MSSTDTQTPAHPARRREINPPEVQAAVAAAAAPPPPPQEEQPHIVRPLIPGRIHLSHAADGAVGNIWTAVCEDKTPLQDVFDPVFFSAKAGEMKAGDRIDCLTDTGLFDVGLRVRQTFTVGFGNQPNRVRVYRLWAVEPPALERHFNEFDLQIRHMGPQLKWCLMRENSIVQSGFETQADAERARRNAASSRNTPPKG